jgi:hypothetical protein
MKNKTKSKKISKRPRKVRPGKKTHPRSRARQVTRSVPRNAKQYFAMARKTQQTWDSVGQVVTKVRSGESLTESSKEFGITPSQVLHLAPSAFRKARNGRWFAKRYDRLLRILIIPSGQGLTEIAIRDSRQASLVGTYWTALHHYLTTGDSSALRKFTKIRITDASGKRVRLMTDLAEIDRQASAGVLQFESIYGRTV